MIGTYKLEKDTGRRHGSLDVYASGKGGWTRLLSVATELAVLDVKVSPKDPSVWVLAHSTGNIMVWKFDEDNNSLQLQENLRLYDEGVLVTSVFFDPANPEQLLATLTSGEAAIVNLQDSSSHQLDTQHLLECWTGAFGEAAPAANVVFTGGDDAKLIAHDLRTNSKIWATSARHHDAGVVLILCPNTLWLLHQPNQLWTGSYDDHLRVFDLRKLDTDDGPCLFPSLLPQELHKVNLNGGVWRLIPAPKSASTPQDSVLACCMYQGAYIVLPEDDKPVAKQFFKGQHDSMVYGGDWASLGEYVVTCSFYDNVVEQWLPSF